MITEKSITKLFFKYLMLGVQHSTLRTEKSNFWQLSEPNVFRCLLRTLCLKNVPPLPSYNFDAHKWILIFLAEVLPIN